MSSGKPDMSISVPLKRTSLLILAVIYVRLFFLEETSFGNENAVCEGGLISLCAQTDALK